MRSGIYGHESNKIFYIPLGVSTQAIFQKTRCVCVTMILKMPGKISKRIEIF